MEIVLKNTQERMFACDVLVSHQQHHERDDSPKILSEDKVGGESRECSQFIRFPIYAKVKEEVDADADEEDNDNDDDQLLSLEILNLYHSMCDGVA